MSPFRVLAAELGTSDRSLRRAANRGLIRARRRGPRRAEIPFTERDYLHRHWDLLSRLVGALRTERNVRLAVLFGSTARGDDTADSDVDIAVVLSDADLAHMYSLQVRLARVAGRPVQLTPFTGVYEDPVLLSEVTRDGRVLIDRDGAAGRWRERALTDEEVDEYLARRGRDAVIKLRDYLESAG